MDGLSGVLDERYINRIYEDMMKEQMDMLRRMKTGGNSEIKGLDRDNAKYVKMLNELMGKLILFRDFREKLKTKTVA
jgi:hypothetical protein